MQWSAYGTLVLKPRREGISIWPWRHISLYELVSTLCKVFTFHTRAGFPKPKSVSRHFWPRPKLGKSPMQTNYGKIPHVLPCSSNGMWVRIWDGRSWSKSVFWDG